MPNPNSSLTIVARYNEDLKWVETIPGDVLIYNKGENYEFDYPRVDIPNIGREAETFLRAIIEYYDQLKKYERIVFLQGNPYDHCLDFSENLYNRDIESYRRISTAESFVRYKMPKEGFIKKWSVQLLNSVFDGYLDFNCNFQITETVSSNIYKESNVLMLFCVIMEMDYKNKHIDWANGAQYMVNPDFITNKSVDWWTNLYDLCHFYRLYSKSVINNGNADYYVGGVLERLWPLIWEHVENTTQGKLTN